MGDVKVSTWNVNYMLHAEDSGGLLKNLKKTNAKNSVTSPMNVIPMNIMPMAMPLAA